MRLPIRIVDEKSDRKDLGAIYNVPLRLICRLYTYGVRTADFALEVNLIVVIIKWIDVIITLSIRSDCQWSHLQSGYLASSDIPDACCPFAYNIKC